MYYANLISISNQAFFQRTHRILEHNSKIKLVYFRVNKLSCHIFIESSIVIYHNSKIKLVVGI